MGAETKTKRDFLMPADFAEWKARLITQEDVSFIVDAVLLRVLVIRHQQWSCLLAMVALSLPMPQAQNHASFLFLSLRRRPVVPAPPQSAGNGVLGFVSLSSFNDRGRNRYGLSLPSSFDNTDSSFASGSQSIIAGI